MGYKGEILLYEVTVAGGHGNEMHDGVLIYAVNVFGRCSFVCHRVNLTGEDGD